MKFILFLVVVYLIYRFLLRPYIKANWPPDASPARKSPPIEFSVRTEYRMQPRAPDPDHDNWEGAFWDVQSPRNLEANLRIEYLDGAGAETKREIHLMRYGPWEGGAILWAYCHLRQANRTFRSDRVLKCVDLDTGEVIADLAAWLEARYQASPDRAIEQIIETAWDAVRVLFYVSKADGRLTQKERAILREAIRGMSDHPAIDDKRIDDLLLSLDVPSIAAFKQAFGRMVNKDKALAERCVTVAEAMIATEKTVAAAEQEALDYLKARLAKADKVSAQSATVA